MVKKSVLLASLLVGYILFWNLVTPSGMTTKKFLKKKKIVNSSSGGPGGTAVGALSYSLSAKVRRARWGILGEVPPSKAEGMNFFIYGFLPSSFGGNTKLNLIHKVFFFIWVILFFYFIILEGVIDKFLFKGNDY